MESRQCIALTTDAEGIAVLTLSRPDRFNAMTPRMVRELREALAEIEKDDTVRALIVTGEGQGFCAGMDLGGGSDTFRGREAGGKETTATSSAREDSFDISGPLALDIFRSSKPVIAAVNGVAIGVGATFTLPMDVRVASTEARFRFPFTRLGISPDACSSWFLPRVVGISTALRWALSGRDVDVDEAVRAGLVHSVHPPDELLTAAREEALRLVRGTSPVSVAVTRRLFWELLGVPDPGVAHRLESRALLSRGSSADAREGVKSFLEKRHPDFPNKVSTDLPEWFGSGPLTAVLEARRSDRDPA